MGGIGERWRSNSMSVDSDIGFFTDGKTKIIDTASGLTRSRKGLTRSRREKNKSVKKHEGERN